MTYIVAYVTKGQWEWRKINGCGILRGIEAGNMHKLWEDGSSTTSPATIYGSSKSAVEVAERSISTAFRVPLGVAC